MTPAPAHLDTRQETEQQERRAGRSISRRASSLRRLAAVWMLASMALVIVAVQERVPVEDLFLDASVVGGGLWYAGLITSLAVMGWTIAAVALGFSALACRLSGRENASRATGSVGLIVALLMFDDLFLLHSAVVPKVLGGSKWWLVVFEAAAILVWTVRWKGEIVRTRWELLAAAGFALGVSLVVDRYPFGNADVMLIAEDGAKLLGVVALATWAVSTAVDLIGSLVQRDR